VRPKDAVTVSGYGVVRRVAEGTWGAVAEKLDERQGLELFQDEKDSAGAGEKESLEGNR